MTLGDPPICYTRIFKAVHLKETTMTTGRPFTPPPKVDSTLVTLIPRVRSFSSEDWNNFEKVTAAAFGQRRKMLRTSLKSLNIDFISLNIDPTARAETLSIDQYFAIVRSIK